MSKKYDVVVIGAGPAGYIAASLLHGALTAIITARP